MKRCAKMFAAAVFAAALLAGCAAAGDAAIDAAAVNAVGDSAAWASLNAEIAAPRQPFPGGSQPADNFGAPDFGTADEPRAHTPGIEEGGYFDWVAYTAGSEQWHTWVDASEFYGWVYGEPFYVGTLFDDAPTADDPIADPNAEPIELTGIPPEPDLHDDLPTQDNAEPIEVEGILEDWFDKLQRITNAHTPQGPVEITGTPPDDCTEPPLWDDGTIHEMVGVPADDFVPPCADGDAPVEAQAVP